MRISDWRSDVWASDLAGLAAAVVVGLGGPAAAAVTVVASIKPVHSLVAAVMQGAGSPHLIVAGGASPHATSLKPSDAAALEQAAVMVWVGEGLEAFLASSLDTLAGQATVLELADRKSTRLNPSHYCPLLMPPST